MKDVLVVGAGPSGLAHAIWLVEQGVSVRVIDKSVGPGESSRAMAVQARTLELYRQANLADKVVDAGLPNPTMNLWVGGKRRAQVSFGNAGADITPYPFMLVYPQDRHELLLIKKLGDLGVTVERQTTLLAFEANSDCVSARLVNSGGVEETCETRYLSGCDGAKSTVRNIIGAGFEGGTYRQIFYVADVQASGLEPAGEAHISLDTADFVAVLSYDKHGGSRLIGTVQDERAERAESLTFADVSHEALDRLGMRVDKVNWFSTYHVHHRVTDHFRRGRAFLLGDAAHVHSPAGGQGMNTGIADAINLAWKMAAVVKGQAPDSLLDSYEAERKAFAHKLVETTDRLFTFVTADGSFADFIRTRIAPIAATFAYKIDNVREYMFRLISQTSLSYRDSPLSQGKSGTVHAGDRLPWAPVPHADNYEPLREIRWQMHIYGTAHDDLRTWCEQHDVALHIFTWAIEHSNAGLTQDAAYLLRPDTYVAFTDPEQSVAALERYVGAHGFFSN